MGVKLGVAISYYNNRKCLDACLHSLHNFHIGTPEWFELELILIDGRYMHYGCKTDRVSSDLETRGLITEHITSMQKEAPDNRFSFNQYCASLKSKAMREKDKRQLAMDLAADDGCDFVLSLDTDEYVDNADRHGSACWPEFANELNWLKNDFLLENPAICGIKSIETNLTQYLSSQSIYRPKLFYRPSKIRYTDNHYTFNITPSYRIASPIALYHDQGCRNQKETEDMEYYKRKLPWIE